MNCTHEVLASKDNAVIKIKKVRNNLDKKRLKTVRIQTELINYFSPLRDMLFRFYKNRVSESAPVKS